MDMMEHYGKLTKYNGWANLEMIASFRAVGSPPAGSVKLMGHIVGAEHTWLARLVQRKQAIPVWPDLDLDHCEQQIRELTASWKRYLEAGPELLEQTVAYKNSKGEQWTSRVQDILTHVFMHSAYHRGQIAADMRQAGYAPAYTDFIHGVRQGLVD